MRNLRGTEGAGIDQKEFRRVPNLKAALLCLALSVVVPLQAQSVSDAYQITGGVSDIHVEYHDYSIKPGEEKTLADIDGPGKITYFYITDDSLFHRTDTSGFAYPGLVLRVYWDGNDKPSINVPLWEFFGNFNRESVEYSSLPMSVTRWNNNCYLPMPFSKHARFSLLNDGDQVYTRSVAFGISSEKDEKFATETSRLHATWSRSNPTRGMHDILRVEGTGQYIGNLQMRTNYAGWWGEGDTIFTIDGKRLPTRLEPRMSMEAPGRARRLDFLIPCLCRKYSDGDRQDRLYRWYIPDPKGFRSLSVRPPESAGLHDKQVDSSDDHHRCLLVSERRPCRPRTDAVRGSHRSK